MMQLFKDWIALLTALVALTTAAVGLLKASQNEKDISRITSCLGEVAVSIDNPIGGAAVGDTANVSGRRSAPHDVCRYVCVEYHNLSIPGAGWIIADLAQVNMTNEWVGRVPLNIVAAGSEVVIDARIASRPDFCRVGQQRSIPLDDGVPSNIVTVRRTQ